VFKEDEFSIWSQHTADAANGARNTGNRAQREDAHDGFNGALFQWNSFAWQVQKFYIELPPLLLCFGQPNHSWVGFQRVDLAHS
jgi:hypothetical protein